MAKSKTFHVTIGATFVALMAIGSNITSIFPFLVVGGVPITLQSFFSILAGLLLGSRLGSFTLFVYTLLGLVGVPIFAQFKGGMTMLFSPTFGFIIAFIIGAYVAGKVRENFASLKGYIIGALIALIIHFVFGANWMYMAYKFWFDAPEPVSYKLVWLWLLAPLPKDLVLALFAGAFAYRLQRQGIFIHSALYGK
ncbi:MAG TPA: biotin transporter BioY [Pseudogracilibacillus sp.]|nr:biotin transporter BioY [Pseudogracilibacillus sp.]